MVFCFRYDGCTIVDICPTKANQTNVYTVQQQSCLAPSLVILFALSSSLTDSKQQ